MDLEGIMLNETSDREGQILQGVTYMWNFLLYFLMWTIFKVFIEFITIYLLCYGLVFWLRGLWDLCSLTRDETHALCTGWPSLHHWATREVPGIFF